MFGCAIKFNQIIDFNTENVTCMSGIFSNAYSFNQHLFFNTEKVTSMREMFCGASIFNKHLDFNTQNVTDMREMFRSATEFNQNLEFNTANVTNMYGMFRCAINFNQYVYFDVSKVINFSFMFFNSNFNQMLDFNAHIQSPPRVWDYMKTVIFDECMLDLQDSCPLSLDDFEIGGEVVKINKCGHLFTTRPLILWFSNETTCPLCKCSI
jgi:hypothetical protein